MKTIPKISNFMTTQPFSIGHDQSIAEAMKLMRREQVRHLPVLEDGRLRGILSDRDIKLYSGLKGAAPEHDSVDAVCETEVYAVPPEAPLDQVVAEMAERRIGCAVVLDNQKLVGIFTAVDALNALSDLLHARKTL